MRYTLLVCTIFLVSIVSSQNLNYVTSNYYSNIYKADSLFLEKEYDKAYSLFNNVFSKHDPLQIAEYYEYTTYTKLTYLLDKENEFINAVENLIKKHGYTREQLEKDRILSKIFILHKEIKVEKLHEDFLKNSELSLQGIISKLKNTDQSHRGSKKKYDENVIKQDSIDSENSNTLISIFETFGFPKYQKIGVNPTFSSTEYDITAMLLHTKDSLKINYFLPKLLDYVKEGSCDPMTYARVYDKHLINNKQQQKYFTFKEKHKIFRKDDIIEINKHRNEIGVPILGSKLLRLSKKYGANSSLVKRMKNMFN